MIAVPGKTDAGLRSSQLVEFVDIFPTIAEVAGLQTLHTCPEPSNNSNVCTEGASLMPLIEDPESPDWKKAVFWQYPRYCIKDFSSVLAVSQVCTEIVSMTSQAKAKRDKTVEIRTDHFDRFDDLRR